MTLCSHQAAAYCELFDASGRRIEPTAEFIRIALDTYIKRLTDGA